MGPLRRQRVVVHDRASYVGDQACPVEFGHGFEECEGVPQAARVPRVLSDDLVGHDRVVVPDEVA